MNNLVCQICLEELNENSVTTTCGHCFHRLCIEEWIDRKSAHNLNLCPICRTVIEKNELVSLYLKSNPSVQKRNEELMGTDLNSIFEIVSKKVTASQNRAVELEQEVTRLKRLLAITQNEKVPPKLQFSSESAFRVSNGKPIYRIASHSSGMTIITTVSGLVTVCQPAGFPLLSFQFKFEYPISCVFFIDAKTVFLGSDQAVVVNIDLDERSYRVIASGILPHKGSVFTCGCFMTPPLSQSLLLLGDSHGVIQMLSANSFNRGGFYNPQPSACIKMIKTNTSLFTFFFNGAIHFIDFSFNQNFQSADSFSIVQIRFSDVLAPIKKMEVYDIIEHHGDAVLLYKELNPIAAGNLSVAKINIQPITRLQKDIDYQDLNLKIPNNARFIFWHDADLYYVKQNLLVNSSINSSITVPGTITSVLVPDDNSLILGTKDGHVLLSANYLQ